MQRVAAIHDLSGFGRTSLTVVIPVISAMGIQVCPMPTAVLSTHTSIFTDYSFIDLTGEMRRFLEHWTSLGIKFDAVYSGFLASVEQMDLVAATIERCMEADGCAVIDPVLGDNGQLDPTMTPEMVEGMRGLIGKADVITPNFTEASFLLGEAYVPSISARRLKEWLVRLSQMGPKRVVITSAPLNGPNGRPDSANISAVGYERASDSFWQVKRPYVPVQYPGTGDTFASVLTGALLQGDILPLAMERAVQFVTAGIRAAYGHNTPVREGILLEQALPLLVQPPVECAYTALEDDGESGFEVE